MSTGNGRPLGRPPHKNSKAAPLQPGDEVGAYTYAQLLRMDRRYVAAAEEAIRLGLERRASAFAEQGTGASDRARGMETGIYGATLQWARIGVIMVACSWHDALGADQLPREIVGNWCLEIERMLPETYAYRRCKDSSYHIIVRPDGFDAEETSCEVNKIERKGAAWLASVRCSGGLTWRRMTKFELARTAGRWRPRSRTYVALAILSVTAWPTNARGNSPAPDQSKYIATKSLLFFAPRTSDFRLARRRVHKT